MNKSKCCKAETTTHFGEEGTNCYVCTKCKKPCDLNPSNSIGLENNQEKAGKKCIDCEERSRFRDYLRCKECLERVGIVVDDITPQPESEGVKDRKTLENKLVKYFWTECCIKNKIDLSLVDGSEDFSIIPRNSKGKIQLEVGELRDIIHDAFDVISEAQAKQIRREERERAVKIVREIEINHCGESICRCCDPRGEAEEKILNSEKDL
jgi:hypothetical protein